MNDNRSGLQGGLLSAAINFTLILLGVTNLVGTLVADWFRFQSLSVGAALLLIAVAAWGSARAVSRPGPRNSDSHSAFDRSAIPSKRTDVRSV